MEDSPDIEREVHNFMAELTELFIKSAETVPVEILTYNLIIFAVTGTFKHIFNKEKAYLHVEISIDDAFTLARKISQRDL